MTSDERQLYDLLTDPTWTRYRRVEQEKIPLAVARASRLCSAAPPSTDNQDTTAARN